MPNPKKPINTVDNKIETIPPSTRFSKTPAPALTVEYGRYGSGRFKNTRFFAIQYSYIFTNKLIEMAF